MRKLQMLALSTAVCLSLVPAAEAQQARPAPSKPAEAPSQPAAGPQDAEAQIAELKRGLGITPAQQGQFDAMAAVLRQNAQDMSGLAQQLNPKTPSSAVDSVRTGQRAAELESEGLKRLLPPLQALYDALSPEQKRRADQMFSGSPAPQPPQPQGQKRR